MTITTIFWKIFIKQKAKEVFKPRDPAVLAQMLRERKAQDINGEHIPGCRGTGEIGRRIVGTDADDRFGYWQGKTNSRRASHGNPFIRG